jgi:hypothetical protein
MTAKIAYLVDKFYLSIDQIAKLTDRQIMEIYFHKRNEDGCIVFPQSHLSTSNKKYEPLVTAIQALEYYKAAMTQEKYDEAKQKLIVKYGDSPESIAMINQFCQGKPKFKIGNAI